MKTLLRQAGEWAYSIVIAAVFAVVINAFIFQPTKVMGQSMEPSYHEGQRIYLSKVPHTFGRMPAFGDVVVIDSRVNRSRGLKDDLSEPVNNIVALVSGSEPAHHVWVKRVIGLPGDQLEFKNGHVYRNGGALIETYIKEPMRYSSPGRVTVPAGHVFVMGDNRNNSNDSRFIGPVPVDHVLGIKLF